MLPPALEEMNTLNRQANALLSLQTHTPKCILGLYYTAGEKRSSNYVLKIMFKWVGYLLQVNEHFLHNWNMQFKTKALQYHIRCSLKPSTLHIPNKTLAIIFPHVIIISS